MRSAFTRTAIPALALALLAGCSSSDSDPAPDARPTDQRATGSYIVDGETGEINARIHQDDGTVATMRSGEKVPVALPAEFTVYPGAKILSNTQVEHGGGRGTMLVLESDDEPAELAAFYRREAEAAGIAIEAQMAAGRTVMLAGRGPGSRTFSLNVSDESGSTMAQLMIGTGME